MGTRSKAGKKLAREAAARRAALEPPPKQKPTVKYDPILGRRICRQIARGHPLNRICVGVDMPNRHTVYAWVRDNEEFRKEYLIARRFARDGFEDDIIEIVDDTSKDVMELKDKNGQTREVLNVVAVQRAKARVAARQRILDRFNTKKQHPCLEEDGLAEVAAAAVAPKAFPVLTEERRQQIIALRREAIERMETKYEV